MAILPILPILPIKASTVIFYANHTRLSKLNLSGSKLTIARSNFRFAEIRDAIFDGTSFIENRCEEACFINASFRRSFFRDNNFVRTLFVDCDFTDASFRWQSFDSCKFVSCSFANSFLGTSIFTDCGFRNCDFNMVNMPNWFHPSYMEDCTNVPYMPMACPDEGEFIGYKVAIREDAKLDQPPMIADYVIVSLRIPSDAKRSAAGGRKCRCDKAQVIAIEQAVSKYERTTIRTARSAHDFAFKYRVGEEVFVTNFDENPWNECAPGIHFFMNKKEALLYFGLQI